MNYLEEYLPFVKPNRKKTTFFSLVWNSLKSIYDTIKQREFMRKFVEKRKETIEKIMSANIVGMDLEEARQVLPNIEFSNYSIDKTEAYSCGIC